MYLKGSKGIRESKGEVYKMKKGKTWKRGRYFGDMRFKGVSLLPIFFVMVLLLNLILPVVALADPEDKEKKDDKKATATQFTSESNLRANEDVYKGVKPYLVYSEKLHKEMVKRILSDDPLRSTKYSDLYGGDDAGLAKAYLGNNAVFTRMNQDAVGDKAADGKELPNPRGLVWTTAYMLDKDGKVFKSYEELYRAGNLGDDKKVDRPIFMNDLRDYNIKSTKKTRQMGLSFEHNPMIMYGIGMGIGTNDNMIKNRVAKDKKLPYENYLIKHSLYRADSNADKSGDGTLIGIGTIFNPGDTLDESYLSTGVDYKQYTKSRKAESISNGTHWAYAVTRSSLKNYGSNMSVGSDDAGMAILGVDSYGNVITKNLDVVIPSWNNNLFSDFNAVKGKKQFMSQAIMKDFGKNSELVKTALTSKENTFYEGESNKAVKGTNKTISELIDPIFVDGYKPGKKNKLSGGADDVIEKLYDGKSNASKAFLNAVAELIVEKTSADVKAWNKKYLATLESEKDMDAYMSTSNGKFSEYSANNVADAEEALDGVYSAKTLMERIGRILDIGFFELIRLTVASMVADFYNSTIINYSVGDIFYTKLLSESDLWKKAINTLLIVVVSFMSIYLILLVVRMFMGHITIKGILLRFVVLTIATVSPMIVYSPLVNLAFNKPVDMTLGKELDRMFMLDVWLKKWETQTKEADKTVSFLPMGNLRERKEEYTVPIYTSTHVDGYNLNTVAGMAQAGNRPTEGKVVVVNVSAFHIIDWLEKGQGLSLFDFLSNTYTTEYENLTMYEEYAFNTSVNIQGIKDYKGDRLKASTLLRRVYNDLLNEDLIKEPSKLNFNTTLFETTNKLFGAESFDQAVTDQVLFDLTTTSYARKKVYGGTGNDNPYSGPTKKLAEEMSLDLPKDDLFGIRNTVKGLSMYRLGSTGELSAEVTDINRKVADDYIYNFMKLRSLVNSSEYNKAEKSVLLMKVWFEINETVDIPLFPTKYSQSSVTLDTYVRALFIPLNEFKPTATDVDNVAKYITVRSDMVSTILFAVAILGLFLYGMIKFFVLFVVLMPLILASFFYNYVWLENTKSKAWVGALGIMGSFALINLGLMLLWKGLIYTLNVSIYESAQVGTEMYPSTLLHSLALLVYLILAFQFILRPLARTVKSDIGNLGGTRMADRAVAMGGDVKAGLKNFWNNMKDPGAVAGKTRTGNGMMSAFSAAKNSLRGKMGKDTGLAGALDPAKMAERRTSDEKKRDAAEVANVDKKLEMAANANKSRGDGSGVAGAVVGATNVAGAVGANAAKVAGATGAAKVAGAGLAATAGVKLTEEALKAGKGTFAQRQAAREERIAANRAGAGEAGANSMLNVLGLGKLRNAKPGVKTDDRSMFEKLKDAKNAAGQAWVDSTAEFDSEMAKNSLARVKSLIKTSEEIDAIPEIEDGSIPLTAEDMKVLEEMGMDHSVVSTDSRIGKEPVAMEVGKMSGMVSDVMAANGLNVASGDGKVVLDLTEEEMADASKRKQVLMPVLNQVGSLIDEVSNSSVTVTNKGAGMVPEKITDKRYRLEDNEMRPHVLKYVEKLRKEGVRVSVSETGAGVVELAFEDAQVAKESVAKIQENSFAAARALGIVVPSSYDVDEDRAGAMQFELDQAGVGYNMTKLDDGTTNFALTGGMADVEKVDGILSTHGQIASAVREISGGIDTVDSNHVIKTQLSELSNSGVLSEGSDYTISDNGSVTLMSDAAKRSVMDVQSNYGSHVKSTVDELQNFAISVGNTIVGNPDGMEVSSYVAGTSDTIDSGIVESGIGRETYALNNRSFDVAAFEKKTAELEKLRHNTTMMAESTKADYEGALEESKAAYAKLLPEITMDDLTTHAKGGLSKAMEDNVELFESFSNNELSAVQLEEKLTGINPSYGKAFKTTLTSPELLSGKVSGEAFEKAQAAEKRTLDAMNAATKRAREALSEADKKLLYHATDARAMDIQWDRTGENTMSFSSSIKNQQHVVEALVSSFDTVSKQKPKADPNAKPKEGPNGQPGPRGRETRGDGNERPRQNRRAEH